MIKNLNSEELNAISLNTLAHYEERAQAFWQGTQNHDVRQNYQAFLSALSSEHPLKILDFGCGPGRDLDYFRRQGIEAIGLEGAGKFCQMAKKYSGCEVWQQDFLKLKLPAQFFDGIFANASLFHIPKQELPRVLKELCDSLKKHGILFSSNPRGQGESCCDQRYACYMEFPEYQNYLEQSGFKVLQHYYRPEHKPREEQPWLAVVSQKID